MKNLFLFTCIIVGISVYVNVYGDTTSKGKYTAKSDEIITWKRLENEFHWVEGSMSPCCGRKPCEGVRYSCCPPTYEGNFCLGNIEFNGKVTYGSGINGIKIYKNTVIIYPELSDLQ